MTNFRQINLLIFIFIALSARHGLAQQIESIVIEGNAKVEKDAIVSLMSSKTQTTLNSEHIQNDIRSIYELGYFSDIQVFQASLPSGKINLKIKVKEKPAISSIEFEGLDQISEEDLQEVIESKIFTIVNESTITSDLQAIEKQYAQKGYYLASINYELIKDSDKSDEVKLVFHIREGQIVKIGSIEILGNEQYSNSELQNMMMAKAVSRTSSFGSSSLYQEEMVERDAAFLDFYYRDHGYAEVKVEEPQVTLDPDRSHVRIVYRLEEGLQYSVGTIQIQGDILYPDEELKEKMLLKPGDIFSHSKFVKDIEMLKDKYGDFGFAYADINPIPSFDREGKIANIRYIIQKGEKVYFGRMKITGNTKTRDNVIRRELEVFDSELFSGTRLSDSRKNIQRLGFFENVKVLRERD